MEKNFPKVISHRLVKLLKEIAKVLFLKREKRVKKKEEMSQERSKTNKAEYVQVWGDIIICNPISERAGT